MKELDLTQFKDLVGELDSSESSYALEDILQETFDEPGKAAQTEEWMPSFEHAEPIPQAPEAVLEELGQVISAAEEQRKPVDTAAAEPDGEQSTRIIIEEPPAETEIPDVPEETVPVGEKKHIWDDWVIPEEPLEEGEEILEEEQPEADWTGEDERLEKIPTESLEDMPVQPEEEIEPEELEPEQEEPFRLEPEDYFKEKKPKRHFWDRWLMPEEADEDEEQPPEPAEVPDAEPPVEPVEEPAAEQPAEEVTVEVAPEEVAEEPLEEAAEECSEEPLTEDVWEPEPDAAEEDPTEQPEEPVPEETQPVVEQADARGPEETEQPARKGGFWKKWFTPIEAKPKPDSSAPKPENVDASEPSDVRTEAPRMRAEDTPTISEEELAAFLQQEDEKTEVHTSFAELMQESGVDWKQDEPEAAETKSKVVYVELGGKKNKPKPQSKPETPFEPEPTWDWVGKTVEHKTYVPREFPRPEWMDLTVDRLSEIAPEVERRNGEPILMTELRRLAKQREQARQSAAKRAEPVTVTPQTPRTFVSETAAAAEDGGDDGESGGISGQNVIAEAVERSEAPADEAVEAKAEGSEPEAPAEPEKETAKPPLSAKKGYKQWNRQRKSIGRRSVMVGILTLLALYLSCSATMGLPIPAAVSHQNAPQIFYLLLIGLAVLAMLAAWDVVSDAVRAVLRRRPDFCTLTVLSLVMTLVHSAVRIRVPGEEIAYPCVAMAALFALMRARMAQASARRNTYKAAGSNPAPLGIFLQKDPKPHLTKVRLEDETAFLRSMEKDNWYSRFERLYTPVAIVVSLVLAAVLCTMARDNGRFWYAFSALLVASCQIGLLTAVAFGCAGTTKRLLGDQAALAGLASAVRMANTTQVVMTEEDLFPAGSIRVDEYVDIRGAMRLDEVLAYAAAVEGDSALGKVLRERIRQRYGEVAEATDAVRYDNGGNGAIIDGQEVLFGTAAFMNDQKIPIPSLPNENESLFLAVDGKTEAVFEVEYTATTQVYAALQSLEERRISILFQLRDCHLSAERLSDLFGLRPGMIQLPDTEQLRKLQDPEQAGSGTPLAILTRDGAAPYADCVDAACALRRLTVAGTALGLAAAVLDVLLMTYLCYVFAPLSASPLRVLLYSVLWFIPILFIAGETKRG